MRAVRSYLLLVFFIALLIAGCNDGGEARLPGDRGDIGDGGDTPIAVLDVAAHAEGEAVPGQTIKLIAQESDGVSYQWQQDSGPAVALEHADSRNARFRIPPLENDTDFTFTLYALHADGRRAERRVRIGCKALTWRYLKPIEIQVTDSLVVFRANKDNQLRIDLYQAELDGSGVTRLNDRLPPNGDVHAFAIAPDGGAVAYLADQQVQGQHELYVVELDDGAVSKVSVALGVDADVTRDFVWSPDSQAIAYRADHAVDEAYELLVAYRDGDASVPLSGPMTAGGDLVAENFFWSSDSQYVAYRADQFIDDVLELFVADVDAGTSARVSAPTSGGHGVLGYFRWAPDGQSLAYVADQVSNVYELFVVDADGGNNIQVSGPLAGGDSVLDFAWSPDGSNIAYRAERLSDGVIELLSVLPDGSGETLLSALAHGGADVHTYEWAPDGSVIAYVADQISEGVQELFVTGPDGSSNRRVSGPLVTGGAVHDFAWSPDASAIAYRADQLAVGSFQLFVSSADGATNVRVSRTPVGDGVAPGWRWSADGSWLAYRAPQRFANGAGRFSASPDGALNIRNSGPLVSGGNVEALQGAAFHWTADSAMLIYSADQRIDDTYELFVTAPDAGIVNAAISGELTAGGDVIEFALGSEPATGARARRVAILAVDLTPAWQEDVQTKIAGTGKFDRVFLIDGSTVTPSLNELLAYGAVFVYTASTSPPQPEVLGDTLADYVDAGGGVVFAEFGLISTQTVGGRFRNEGYFVIEPQPSTGGSAILQPVLPGHPILNGVATFDGGSSSYRPQDGTIAPGATVVATWNDGRPLVVTHEINGVRRADLGMFPPSGDAAGGWWDPTTDGDVLMANALLYVMGEI